MEKRARNNLWLFGGRYEEVQTKNNLEAKHNKSVAEISPGLWVIHLRGEATTSLVTERAGLCPAGHQVNSEQRSKIIFPCCWRFSNTCR